MPLHAERLREMREKKGLTQRELAHLCGMNEHQVFRYENGKSDPSATNLGLIARELGVSADYLLGLSDYPNGQFGESLQPDQSQLLKAYVSGDTVTIMELVSARLRQLSKNTSNE
jgi:transcriptional regulator with XRE-family HTH domain